MKILSVLNPSLDDYKISGAALLGINLGEYINIHREDVSVDYIASKAIDELLDTKIYTSYYNPKVYTPELSKRSVVSDTIKFAINKFYEGNYDVMHIHLHQMSVLSSINKLIPKDLPVVYTQHSSTILGRFSLGYREDARNLSTDINRRIRIVCPSESMRDIWFQYIETSDTSNVYMIRNGIKLLDMDIKSNDNYISCGRIDPNKGMLEVAKLCDRYKHNVILIGDIGMGSLKISEDARKYYEEFERICNNSEYIKWYKYLPNSIIRKLMMSSKAYISLSHKESFGLTVAESLSTGTPVLYLEESAINELVNDSVSVKIPKSDIYRKSEGKRLEIYNKYVNIIDDLISSNKINSDNVISRFNELELSISSCCDNYINLYKDVINN